MAVPLARHETLDQGKRMRHETRIVEVFDPAPAVQNTEWNGLIARIVRVQRSTLIRHAKNGMWDRREDVSFYLCSAPISAEKAAQAIRDHWAVENRNHYVRDVAMLEDASPIRTNPAIFARARSFAFNILRANGETNIADALWRNAIDFKRVLKYRYE
jgi:predicted transposase YbfD/YdcC